MFPTQAEWIKKVVQPDDSKQFNERRFYDYYQTKYAIAARCRPTRICEIGVRYGYSAWSFLCAAPDASYTGIDLQQGTHGGAKGVNTFAAVEALLARDYPDATVELIEANSQAVVSLGGRYDFIHVDGDHSEPGCRYDLELALKALTPGGAILVDDYDYIDGVHRAVDAFYAERADEFAAREYIPSLRGDILLIRKGR